MNTTALPDPQRVRLNTFAALRDAVDRLLPLAQERIAIFDFDLRDTGWNTRLRGEAMEHFLLASRSNRIDIVLHETEYVASQQARVMQMLRRFSDRMEIRRTQEEVRHVYDPFVLIDSRHYLHRFHYDRANAEFVIAQPELAHALVLRFEELWQASDPGPSATVLGL